MLIDSVVSSISWDAFIDEELLTIWEAGIAIPVIVREEIKSLLNPLANIDTSIIQYCRWF
ncbi:hypothetical protein DNK47_02920 [Mycoplasma wenyonii]|uniref:Uncharacterized protein n=1 Tax=Mycoplasma wenyonii TaxID=65123 RepID=A0A328PSX5_9MOLU|nr:hypothetical protein [Mycoplasma wenyonii]RAO94840.1 hypothetical protein DNK47_02920 [Mycoplasma wenyonii]